MAAEKISVTSVPTVEVKLSGATLHRLRTMAVDVGRILRRDDRRVAAAAVRLLEDELLHEGGGGVPPWRIERLLERLRDLSETEGD